MKRSLKGSLISNSTGQDSIQSKGGLNRYGVELIVREFIRPLVHLAILLISAGKIDWINAWIYTSLFLFLQIVQSVVLIKINPQLLNERRKFIQKNTKAFDKIFYALGIPLLLVTLSIAGLDVVRYEWSNMSFRASILGVVMFIPAFMLWGSGQWQ